MIEIRYQEIKVIHVVDMSTRITQTVVLVSENMKLLFKLN